jgi:acetylornithine deacetylase/succinyl-diaminopimelate desuccinylase-like protein
MKERGLENCRILEIPGAHPYAYGERLRAPGAPTLLLYAHHDVQPVGREHLWKTKPFEPTLAPGPGGERLWGRGTADDKAGVIIHLAAIDSILKSAGELPVNVKVVIEGEEETGSAHLPEFLKTYRHELDADVIVLTDTTNFDCGIPALTIALRGLVGLDVEVRALSKSIHSGMWGGPVPDSAMALSKMLASLVDAQGRISIPGVLEQVPPLTDSEIKKMNEIPFDEAAFRDQSGMLPKTQLLREGPSPHAQLWRFPSLTINAIQASKREGAANIINDSAWAKVTIRTVQGMDPRETLKMLQDHLRKTAPWGVEVEFKVEACNGAWAIKAEGAAFDAADAAMAAGYGRKPIHMGCGGSIPFVEPFSDALGGAPALLIGVEDPYTNAHGENESCLVSDLKKSCVSQVHLFYEIAKRGELLGKS